MVVNEKSRRGYCHIEDMDPAARLGNEDRPFQSTNNNNIFN
jgi:hypothetical protein